MAKKKGQIRVGGLRVDMSANFATFDNALSDVRKKLKKTTRELQGFGREMSRAISLPLAGIGALSIRSSIQFESAFAGVRKTVNATEGEFQRLADGLRQMSREIPVTTTELAKIEEAAGQLGIKTKNIDSFTRTMAKLGVSTNLSADQAATALARFVNITQLPQEKIENLGSAVVALGNNFATTESEIVEMGLRLAGAGKQIGLTDAQILGFATALSSVGIEAEAGGTAFSRVFKTIQVAVEKGGNAVTNFAKVANLSSKQFSELFKENAAEGILRFIDGLGKIKASGGSVIQTLQQLDLGDIRVSDSLLRVSGAGDLARRSVDLAGKSFTENAALTNEANQRFKTTESQLGLLHNRLNLVAESLGNKLKPAFLSISKVLVEAVEAFDKLGEPTKDAIIAFSAVAALAGPLALAVSGLSYTIAALSTPIGAVAITVASLAAAFTFNVGNIQKACEELAGFVTSWAKTLNSALQHVLDFYKSGLNYLIKDIERLIAQFRDTLALLEKLKTSGPSLSDVDSFRQPDPFSAFLPKPEEVKKSEQSVAGLYIQMEKFAESTGIFETATSKVYGFRDSLKSALNVIGGQSSASVDLLAGKLGGKKGGSKGGPSPLGGAADEATEALKRLQGQLDELKSNTSLDALREAYNAAIEAGATDRLKPLEQAILANVESGTLAGLAEAAAKAGPAGQAIAQQIAKATADKTRESLDQALREKQKSQISEGIELSIKNLDLNAFQKYATELRDITKKSALEGFKGAIGQGLITPEQADEMADRLADDVVKPYGDKLKDAQKDAANQAIREYSAAFDQIAGDFSNIIGGIDSELGSMFSDLFNSLGDDLKASIIGGIADALGASSQEVQEYADAAGTVLGAALSAKDEDRAHDDNRGTGKAVGAGAGAIIGGIFGGAEGAKIGAQVGGIFGDLVGRLFPRGPQDPETQARHAFAGFIEDSLKKLGEVTFFDAQGKLQKFSGNFIEGDTTRFNDPNWADQFNQDPNSKVFTGLGQALEELLGLTEDVGSQIGYLLSENLAGNIDNARLMVQYLGLDLQTVTDKLVEAGLRGEMSWHEVEVSIQGVTEAFKPGLAAANATGEAFDHIIDSGGKGFDAIKAVKDLAVEGMEKGLHTLDELKQDLIAQGKDPQYVEALFAGFEQRGLESLQEIADAQERVLGGVVADMQSASPELAKIWEDMNKQLEETAQIIKDIPEQIDTQVNLNWNSQVDETTQKLLDAGAVTDAGLPDPDKFALGGVVDSARLFSHGGGRLGLMGEAGPEAILPLARINGRLGVRALTQSEPRAGSPVVINIDARGAEVGVEQEIHRVLTMMRPEIVADAVNVMVDGQARGRC